MPKAVVYPAGGTAAATLSERLFAGKPGIQTMRGRDRVLFNPMSLRPGEAALIAARLREALS